MLSTSVRAIRGLSDWRLWGALIVTAIGIAAVESNQHWSPPGGQGRAVVKLSIYWLSWLAWPAALLYTLHLIGHLARGRLLRALGSLIAVGACAFVIWARFVEPNELRVVESSVSNGCGVRVALVADLHSGLYVREHQLERLVQTLNTQDVDAVLVAGDWTYEPLADLRTALAPLRALRHKTYAVLGNHDEASPGPDLRGPLLKQLAEMRVEVIEGKRVPLGRCELIGLGDLMSGGMQRDLDLLGKVRPTQRPANRVVLTHDPDAQLRLPAGFAATLLGGHTHGGQIELPWLTDLVLARMSRSGFQRGLYDRPNLRVFVTSGIGMVALPLRFRMPPTIDILAL